MQLDFCQLILQQHTAAVCLADVLLVGQMQGKKEQQLLIERSALVEEIFLELQNTKTFSALETFGSMSPQKSPKSLLKQIERLEERNEVSSTSEQWEEMFRVDKEEQRGLRVPEITLQNCRKLNRIPQPQKTGIFDFCQQICTIGQYDVPSRPTPMKKDKPPSETSISNRINETPIHKRMQTPTDYLRT